MYACIHGYIFMIDILTVLLNTVIQGTSIQCKRRHGWIRACGCFTCAPCCTGTYLAPRFC
ncbi:hypothetical protein PF010_g20251 [Phytophthora fragariae]|uniref:Uncharacterized protein n=1 Tax=Phytophthora fragariae TaxID=53985 RepID=A0A6A3SD09_9STRA|nr:hypothetical protein PF003_g10026 [Phytophthora fragariae]KAE9086017.1 hypothetical protein PF010_g20251 [Phytophthora fragariae]KAE9113268.1 hypothetical protein PF006_g19788 [Phytophthora fragariae]